jgi:threonine aldolase
MNNEKYSFRNDYSELIHPQVLAKLASVKNTQFTGYGLDEFSEEAKRLIREKIEKPDADVHLVSGGTQANLIVLSSALRPHEAVISSEFGHIFTHETGAIEATGHKICSAKCKDGKLTVRDIESIVTYHKDEHMVKPKVVFISLSTEMGTVYTKKELTKISDYCRAHHLYLYIDGARLGAGLSSLACDLTYPDIANLVDAFYIGGTKNGILCGEAIVICNERLKEDFRYHIKQKGGLLAKGAAIGLQFIALFEQENEGEEILYDKLALKANKLSMKFAKGIGDLGYDFYLEPETNQIFPVFPNGIIEKLHERYEFHDWMKVGEEETVARLITSWATTEEAVAVFLEDLRCITEKL